MIKSKLNIRYHNPNSAEELIHSLTIIFTEASKIKFEKLLQETVGNKYKNKQESPIE